jgi:hypothetical protein
MLESMLEHLNINVYENMENQIVECESIMGLIAVHKDGGLKSDKEDIWKSPTENNFNCTVNKMVCRETNRQWNNTNMNPWITLKRRMKSTNFNKRAKVPKPTVVNVLGNGPRTNKRKQRMETVLNTNRNRFAILGEDFPTKHDHQNDIKGHKRQHGSLLRSRRRSRKPKLRKDNCNKKSRK